MHLHKTEIKLGTLIRSELFPDSDELQCTKITDVIVEFCHISKGSIPIIYDQKALDNSKWIISGYSKTK